LTHFFRRDQLIQQLQAEILRLKGEIQRILAQHEEEILQLQEQILDLETKLAQKVNFCIDFHQRFSKLIYQLRRANLLRRDRQRRSF
jgi:hypothetical protein